MPLEVDLKRDKEKLSCLEQDFLQGYLDFRPFETLKYAQQERNENILVVRSCCA